MEGLSPVLDGIRVIDVTQHGAAPMASCLLAQWGAEVIHIEHPVKGDGGRGLQAGGAVSIQQHKINYVWELVNLNKKSLTADLAQQEGREIIYRLAARSDVFLSNLRPREVEKFEMHYETLKRRNPEIIYANLTGYGPKGPDANSPGWDDSAYFSRAGIIYTMSEEGEVPVSSRPALGDFPTGMACAFGIMIALFARQRLGIGQELYTSLFNSGVWASMFDVQGALLTHQDPPEYRRDSVPNPLGNTYKTKDGRWIRLTMLQPDPYWPGFCQAIGQEELHNDPRFDSIQKRTENNVALIKIIEEAIARRTAEEWTVRLGEFGLSFGLIQKPSEVAYDPQARANEFFTPVNHPNYGPIELVLAPIKFSKTPGAFRTPAPEFGQHTEEILLEIGYSWDDIGHLRDKKVI
jgi:crotonobetainyl-CoA:carnitine CoA-transferase CaiB-like acyl-CoA transferase